MDLDHGETPKEYFLYKGLPSITIITATEESNAHFLSSAGLEICAVPLSKIQKLDSTKKDVNATQLENRQSVSSLHRLLQDLKVNKQLLTAEEGEDYLIKIQLGTQSLDKQIRFAPGSSEGLNIVQIHMSNAFYEYWKNKGVEQLHVDSLKSTITEALHLLMTMADYDATLAQSNVQLFKNNIVNKEGFIHIEFTCNQGAEVNKEYFAYVAQELLGSFGKRVNQVSESREQFDISTHEDTFVLSGMSIYYLYDWKRN